MAVVRKKQDDKYLKVLRELVTSGSGGNRQCFDCGQKGPTYVNMTIGSFVCTRCSGVLRGLTPPHRVKSISMATFTPEEIEFLKSHGNDTCAKTWLGLWDPKRAVHQDQRELMIDKYERKRYFLEPASPLKSLTNATKLTPSSNNSSSTHSLSSINNNLSGSNGNIQAMNQKNGGALDNSFQNITLTPPSSRSNGNAHLNGYGPSAISRPNHQQPAQQNGHHHYDAFANGLNGFSVSSNGNSKSGFNSSTANSDTSSCHSNGFTPESDFVADFSSANIFDATSTNSVASSGSGSSGSNGYAKIQPITAAQLMNGNGKAQNGGGGFSAASTNGTSENFADFDHAPIFNAAEFNNKTTANGGTLQTRTNNNHNNTNNNNLFFTSSTNQQTQRNLYSNSMFDLCNDLNSISLFESIDDDRNKNSLSKNIFNNCSSSSSSSTGTVSYPHYSSLSSCSSFSQTYSGQQQQNQHLAQQKFTPLAMAAHATAMAVLGHNSSNLNNNNINSSFGVSSQWSDAWKHQDTSTAPRPQWPGLSSAANNGNNDNAIPFYNQPLSISVADAAAAATTNPSQHSNRNSWSLPISNSTTSNSLSSSATFNLSSSSNASPPADRYAALKDLDEQLRESKAVAAAAAAAVATSVVDSFGGAHNNTSNANPFKTAVNPQQAPQIANPFQANQSLNPVAGSLFGGMPQNQQHNGLTNGFVGGMAVPQQAFYNYTNGFGAPAANMYPSGPNGCGFGFGAMQQPIATGGGVPFNNPFAATGALNSNNPFL